MEPLPHVPVEQCLTLNEVSRIIASRRNLSDLFHDLAEWLHRLLDFSYLGVMLYDPAQHVMRLHNLQGSPHGPLRPGAEFAVKISRRGGSGSISSRWSSPTSNGRPAFPGPDKLCVSTGWAPSAPYP